MLTLHNDSKFAITAELSRIELELTRIELFCEISETNKERINKIKEKILFIRDLITERVSGRVNNWKKKDD